MKNELYKTLGDLRILRDTRFLADQANGFNLQMKYRIEHNGEVIAFIRYVNHGRDRWLVFDPQTNECWAKGPKLDTVVWNLAH